ncbi:fungal specific transcription factor [Cordyceps javanica]|uniref:Fungal specific transcription factor n=1 Tax=Cordyceps javanica TaxID=43265 RepID=A0A545UWA6_9HYPO|nr:fungal specific transcription factor [Cordyceps javanica]TQW04523.1 fungal specific transcription factor [Cordyceps javanica]
MVLNLENYYKTEDCLDDDLKDRKRRHVSVLFGVCYILDKDIALRFGRPPLLTEDYCDLAFMDSAAGGTDIVHEYPTDPKLSLIKERICCLLYSPKADKGSDGEILHNIRQLDYELEQWRLSMPGSLRPRLSISLDSGPAIREAATRQDKQIALQLDYHYTLITIHTMVRKCGASNEETDLPEDLHGVIHSSVDLSLEAGRSTLLFLKFSLSLLGAKAFQYIQSFAPVAAMALFVNVLVHPLGDSSQGDLETLIQAVGTFQTIPIDSLSGNEIQQIQALCEFIMELVRLGSCAIWKAKTDRK